MYNLKHKKLLGIALAAIVAACDNGSDGDDQQPPPPPPEVNLLEDISDMDAGYVGDTKYWNHWGYTPVNPTPPDDVAVPNPMVAGGTYEGMEGSVLQATSTDFGNADYKAQIVAGNGADYNARIITLKAGKQYTIRFKGAASGPANVKAILQNPDYSNAYELPAELTASATEFESEEPFVVGDEDKQVKFIFNIGGNPANTIIYLDDAALLEEDAEGEPPPPPPPPEVNLLDGISDMDASYAGQTTHWNHFRTGGDAVNGTSSAGTYAGMDGGVFQLTSANFGADDWNYQIVAGTGEANDYDARSITLAPGKVYTITFKAAASNNGSIKAYLKINDQSEAGSKVASLTSTTGTFTSDPITVTSSTPVTFVINAGGLPADTFIYLDDVKLLEADAQ